MTRRIRLEIHRARQDSLIEDRQRASTFRVLVFISGSAGDLIYLKVTRCSFGQITILPETQTKERECNWLLG